MAPAPAEILAKIEKNAGFKAWKAEHKEGYLSHFFCPITADCEFKGDWEVGFYDPHSEKITVFACGKAVMMKQNEDDVFKKPEQSVEELNLDSVKVSFQEAVDALTMNVEDLFPKAQRGDGFVILQAMGEKSLWNFTFVTRDLKFINVKINAETGSIESHLSMDLIDRGQ